MSISIVGVNDFALFANVGMATDGSNLFVPFGMIMRSHFRPCIDLHDGQVKQIVGGTLRGEIDYDQLKTNFVSLLPARHFASLYRKDNLVGGHVIMLGPNNEAAVVSALSEWPGCLQVGGGINLDSAQEWLRRGASKVIVTSWLFPDGKFSLSRLAELSKKITKDKLVVDLSCRKVQTGRRSSGQSHHQDAGSPIDSSANCGGGDSMHVETNVDSKWLVVMNKWQTLTELYLCQETLEMLSEYCSEILVHAADVEGMCGGIDVELVRKLGYWVQLINHQKFQAERCNALPYNVWRCTYAGGARNLDDIAMVNDLSGGWVDVTVGSALDILGGKGVKYVECVEWNKSHPRSI